MAKLKVIFFSFFLILIFSSTPVWSITETIVIMRHAEKPKDGLGQLSCQGLNRSLALPKVLTEKFGKPDFIFAPNPSSKIHDKGHSYSYIRPIATIEPTAIANVMPLYTQYGFGDVDNKNGLAGALLSPTYHDSLIFITWEHKYAAILARNIAAATGYTGDIPDWSNDEFDKLYVFTINWNDARPDTRFTVEYENLNNLSTECPAFSKTASDIPKNLLPGLNTIQKTELKNDINFLTQDNLQGRLSLTEGDNQSAQWIAEQFKKSGLKPALKTGYLQAVPLIEYYPDSDKSYIALESGDKITQWKKPDVYTQYPENIDLKSEVVFAGYGITAPELNYDDYQDIDVHGKIVLVFEHEPQETNPASIFNGIANTPYATPYLKILNAQKHGALAVLIAPEPNRKHPSNQERRLRIGGSINIKLPSQVLADETLRIPSAIISDDVAKQIAGNQLSLSQLQTAIDEDLTPHSTPITGVKIIISDKNKTRKTGTTYNVAGLLEGSDPELKQETIIISAHHDHDGNSGKQIWRGADDNASGTAGVISLAKALAANTHSPAGLKPRRSILFVVFAAEERGLLGAFYMAAHPLRPLETTRAMINFDMIGRNESPSTQTDGLIDIPQDTANRLNLIGAHYSPDYDKIVAQQNRFVGLTLDHRFDNDSALNIFFRSDQFPFVLQHIPAFWWFTGFHQDYHHTTDTADKINYVKMEKILRLSYLSAFAFANEPTPPKFIENPGA